VAIVTCVFTTDEVTLNVWGGTMRGIQFDAFIAHGSR
jgi:hypothetical protein